MIKVLAGIMPVARMYLGAYVVVTEGFQLDLTVVSELLIGIGWAASLALPDEKGGL